MAFRRTASGSPLSLVSWCLRAQTVSRADVEEKAGGKIHSIR
ncbi:hypothetical protein [Streptomyces albidoflavus]|nr:hypothetical protein [Streptomyces albidoflavus]